MDLWVGSVPDECSQSVGQGRSRFRSSTAAGFKSLTCPRIGGTVPCHGRCGERPRAGALSLTVCTHAVAVAAAAAWRASAFRGRPAPPDVTFVLLRLFETGLALRWQSLASFESVSLNSCSARMQCNYAGPDFAGRFGFTPALSVEDTIRGKIDRSVSGGKVS
jgi:hypothetical protein